MRRDHQGAPFPGGWKGRSYSGRGGIYTAVLAALGLHLFAGTVIGVRFCPTSVGRIPASTFLGPILLSGDFIKINNIEDRSKREPLPVDPDFVGAGSKFSPSDGETVDKPGYGLVKGTGQEGRRYLKVNFLNKSAIEKSEQQKFLKQMGLDPETPVYDSLRSFRSKRKEH